MTTKDLIRVNMIRGDLWRARFESFVLALSFFGGAGYALWLFGRRFCIRGFSLYVGRKVMRYRAGATVKEKRDGFVAGVQVNGNGGWMPQWS